VRSSVPPRLATWILKHFGCSPQNESIIGDLNERYRRGRSGLWYWRQCLVAVVSGFLNDVMGHKLPAGRALLTGWAVLYLYQWTFSPLLRITAQLPRWSFSVLVTLNGILFCAISGWLIRRLHRPHDRSMVLVFALSTYCGLPWLFFLLAERRPLVSGRDVVLTVLSNLLVPISILIGGGIFRTPRDEDRREAFQSP
jgi:hypothetical protein